MLLDDLDIQLLSAVAEAQFLNHPISTWFLAEQKAKTPAERNKLDGLYRYRLKKLAEKGFLIEQTYRRGKKQITGYIINPKRFVCYKGALFLFPNPATNPITILLCPYTEKCKSKCKVNIYEHNGKLIVKGCQLLAEAPEHIKKLAQQAIAQQP